MSNPLHKHIVAIVWRDKFRYGHGSGLLISQNLILTSAHNLFYMKSRVPNQNFKIYIGQCGEMKVYYSIEQVFIPK